jgi:hypothetical protein
MPSSSGTYTLYTPGNPVVTGTSISSSWANNTLNDIASAITVRWPRDGTAPPTANMPMGSFKLTGLAGGSALTDSVNFGQVQNSADKLITGVAGTDTITGSIVTPTLAAYANGQRFTFVAAATNTGPVTININSLGAKAITKNGTTPLVAGDIVSGVDYSIFYDGTQFRISSVPAALPNGTTAITQPVLDNSTKIATTAYVDRASVMPVMRGYIDNLTLSTPGASTTITVAAGQATDSTASVMMQLLSATAKTTASWAVGSATGGKLSAAAIANSTWYYWFLIRRPDTGVVDVGFDISPTAPTLPTNYTQYRYIGASLTNGSAQWTKFYQAGDEFLWDVAVPDTSVGSLSTQTSFTQSVPRGRIMTWVGSILWAGAANPSIIVGSPLQTLPSPSPANGDLFPPVAGGSASTMARVSTNTAGQIAARADTASTTFRTRTHGWIDTRGRNE